MNGLLIKNNKSYIKAKKLGYFNEILKYSKDITSEWLGKSPIKENKIIKHKIGDYFKYKGKTYYIDGKNIVIDFKNGEEEFANLLSKITARRIELFPRFNKPDGFKTADYKIGKYYVDYKYTTGSSKQLILHNLRGKEKQSNNFIIEITNPKLLNNKSKILKQVDDTFRRYKWVKIIGIKTPNNLNIYLNTKQKK